MHPPVTIGAPVQRFLAIRRRAEKRVRRRLLLEDDLASAGLEIDLVQVSKVAAVVTPPTS